MRKWQRGIGVCMLALLFFWQFIIVNAEPSISAPTNSLTRDDYLVFVLGCINIPSNPIPCQNDPRLDWRDWLALVRDEIGFGEQHQAQFDGWSKQHIRFVSASTADPKPIEQAIESIESRSNSIYLIGFSAGGAAVLNYLEILRKESKVLQVPIRGAVVLDSPVGDIEDPLTFVIGNYIGFNRLTNASSLVGATDRFAGLGAWCQVNGIRVATLGYEGDYFTSKHQVADIPYKLIPENSQFGGPFDLEKNHGYFFSDPNGLHSVWNYLNNEIFSR